MKKAKFKPKAQLLLFNIWVGKKVKVKFTLEQATKPSGGVEVWLCSLFNLGARWGWVINAAPRPLNPQERDPLFIV